MNIYELKYQMTPIKIYSDSNKHKMLYSNDYADNSLRQIIDELPDCSVCKFSFDDFGGAHECVMKTDWSLWHEIYFTKSDIEYSGVIIELSGTNDKYAMILGCGTIDSVYSVSGDYFDIHSHPIHRSESSGKLAIYNIPSMIDYRGAISGKLSVLVTAFGVIIYGSTYIRKYGHNNDYGHVLNNDDIICHFVPWSKLNISNSSYRDKWFAYISNAIVIVNNGTIKYVGAHDDKYNLHLYDNDGKLRNIVTNSGTIIV